MVELNRFQQAAQEVYASGAFKEEEGFRDVGDTLYTAVMLEISDIEGCNSLSMALSRTQRMIEDIRSVQQRLERLDG